VNPFSIGYQLQATQQLKADQFFRNPSQLSDNSKRKAVITKAAIMPPTSHQAMKKPELKVVRRSQIDSASTGKGEL
jgi:hypothetical protein